jgi:tetratricopeptide (TPR) repeat protein
MTANIEFSCGLAYDGNDFIIPFGFQDSTAFILRLPKYVFENMTDVVIDGEKDYKSKGITPSRVENFVLDPFNANTNFELGEFYFNQGHTASALAFYLRAAEYGKVDDDIYESLLMVAKCLAKQGKRATTEKGLWLNAATFAPNRPEAYLFLSEWSESNNQYHEAYMYAIMGLEKASNAKLITSNVGYIDTYQLEFQKAVLAWWIGRSQESRDEFIKLVSKGNQLNDKYKKLVQTNITSLGSGPDPFLRYHKGFYTSLRYKFPGAENIEKNYSQTYQDMFTLSMLDGKRNGTYFEIGAADPFHGSNTALLEEFGWTGTSLEILPYEVEKFKAARKNEIVLCDATKYDYSVLKGHIDYLQVDCEPPSTTFLILTMLPWDQCTFGVITYEHDHYTDVSGSYRKKSRNFLLSRGYVLVASNIAPNETSCYEDWYVHPKYVKEEIIKIMLAADDSIKNAEKYMLGKI